MINNKRIKYISKINAIFILAIFYLACSPTYPSSIIEDFYNYPNPFNNKNTYTIFKVILKRGDIISAKLDIYSQSGDLLDTKYLTIDKINKKEATTIWSGLDKNGKYLPTSIYISKITIRDNKDSTYIGNFKTLIN